MRNAISRIPTGVKQFDSIINSGIPSGSLVLLLGDVGAGQNEFAYTSAAALAMTRYNPKLAKFAHIQNNGTKIPERLHYITFSRGEEYIKREIRNYFEAEYYAAFEKYVEFRDFSNYYFKNSIIPSSWSGASEPSFLTSGSDNGNDGNLLRALVNYLDESAENSLVIIDSLTDLAVSQSVNLPDLVDTVKGLQRVAKKWDGIVYLILTDNIIPRSSQQIFVESVDGVIMFEWGKNQHSSRRSRYMYLEKFTSLLPYIQREKIARFVTGIAPEGLTVCDWELIS